MNLYTVRLHSFNYIDIINKKRKDMEVNTFEEIKNDIIEKIRGLSLIPVIGSGFTQGCKSNKGQVPSVTTLKEYMISQICNSIPIEDGELEELSSSDFPLISNLYQDNIPAPDQKKYISDNFTDVQIDENKSNFLSVNWPYLYTLNIDDGIENNSNYKKVVYANRPIEEGIFNDFKCTIKLHGDATDMITYKNSDCQVFSQTQYGLSLTKNARLLNKLKHDIEYLNTIFIGCSLSNEIDLLATVNGISTTEIKTNKYFCTTVKPTELKKKKYEQYGITNVIVFDSYDDIYVKLFEAGVEAAKINYDELQEYKNATIKKLTSAFEENKPYLFFGKSLISKERNIIQPHFFISRTITHDIIEDLAFYPIQLIIGSSCSGKTYILMDIALRIRNRAIYLFETKDRISDISFLKMIDKKKDCIILADDKSLSYNQLEYIFTHVNILKNNNINIILTSNKNNREIKGLIEMLDQSGVWDSSNIKEYFIENRLTETETGNINPLLADINVGIFNKDTTIVDNIITTSDKLRENNRFNRIMPRFTSVKDIAALIALATERKIYSKRASDLDVSPELDNQLRSSVPLVDRESTWQYEKSPDDNSPIKYVVNAEYWLCQQLSTYANKTENHKTIVEAYQYIINKILIQEGNPNLFDRNNNASYKSYIKFDVINNIFAAKRIDGNTGLELIRKIYKGLNDILSSDPNFEHQRSKCYIKSALYTNDYETKKEYLKQAFRDANQACQIFEHRFDECNNEKLKISIDHVKYTMALIMCHTCILNNYSNIDEDTETINMLYEALQSPFNSYGYALNDTFNYDNAIQKVVAHLLVNKEYLQKDSIEKLSELFRIISNN